MDIEEINDFFNEWDFLNVVPDGVRNEYEDLAALTSELLEEDVNASALASFLGKTIADRYGLAISYSDKGLLDTSKKILDWKKSKKRKRPQFDTSNVKKIIGKNVLIGYTYKKDNGSIDRLEQKYGQVFKVDKKKGIAIKVQSSDELLWLPPDLRSWKKAPKGSYRLYSTGEVVNNPDYLVTWTVTLPN